MGHSCPIRNTGSGDVNRVTSQRRKQQGICIITVDDQPAELAKGITRECSQVMVKAFCERSIKRKCWDSSGFTWGSSKTNTNILPVLVIILRQ